MSAGPSSPEFWDPAALRREILALARGAGPGQTSDPCCPAIDTAASSSLEIRRFADACDLCMHSGSICSAVRSEGGDGTVDPERVVLRARAVLGRREGIRASDRFLGNSDLIGAIGANLAPASTRLLRSRIARFAAEKSFRVDRRHLPDPFARTPFDRWFRKRERKIRKICTGMTETAALFATCRINYRFPDIGRSAVAVLIHNGVRPLYPEQRCCGRSQLECGDLDGAALNIAFNASSFRRHAEAGAAIVVLGGDCESHIRRNSSWVVAGDDAPGFAAGAVDLFGFLGKLLANDRLRTDFRPSTDRIALVTPARSGEVGSSDALDAILRRIPGLRIERIDAAPRFGWSLANRRQFFGPMEEAARAVAPRIGRSGANLIVTECPATGRRLSRMAGMRALHPIDLVRQAYGIPLAG